MTLPLTTPLFATLVLFASVVFCGRVEDYLVNELICPVMDPQGEEIETVSVIIVGNGDIISLLV